MPQNALFREKRYVGKGIQDKLKRGNSLANP